MTTRTLSYPNLAPYQRDTQRGVDDFNADEAHWRSLEPRRRLRRKILRRTKKQREALDQLEFRVTDRRMTVWGDLLINRTSGELNDASADGSSCHRDKDYLDSRTKGDG